MTGNRKATALCATALTLCIVSFSPSPAHAQTNPAHAQTGPNPPCSTTHRQCAQDLLQSGLGLAQAGRLAESELQLQQALHLDPANLPALETYGKVEARLGHTESAIDALGKAAQLAPRSAQIRLELALALADGKQPEAALQELTAAQALDPNNFEVLLNRARLLDDLHRDAEADTAFARAAKLKPHDPTLLFTWSMLKREMDQLPAETDLLQQLVTLQPRNAIALTRLGKGLSEQGKNAEAIPILERAYASDPSSGESAYLLSRLLRQSDPAAAAKWASTFQGTRHRQASLDEIKTTGNQAVQAAAQGKWAEAVALYRSALASCDHCSVEAPLHKDLGLALCHDNDIPGGIAELKQAYALDPNDPGTVQALRALNALDPN